MRSSTRHLPGQRRQISVSEFKMRCLRLVDEVDGKRREFVITKHGRPVALVTPLPSAPARPTRGRWKEIVRSVGDIVHVDWSDEFDATRRATRRR